MNAWEINCGGHTSGLKREPENGLTIVPIGPLHIVNNFLQNLASRDKKAPRGASSNHNRVAPKSQNARLTPTYRFPSDTIWIPFTL